MTVIVDIHVGANAYTCLSIGNNADCTYDLDRLKELGVFSIPSLSSLLLPVVRNVLLANLALWAAVIIFCTPIFLMAVYLGKCIRIRRNFVGALFWVTIWTFAVLAFPLFGVAESFFRFGNADIALLFEAGGLGVACGVMFCLLVLRSRGAPVQT